MVFRFARAYNGIQFFDHDSLLPPPFTFLSILVLMFQLVADRRIRRKEGKSQVRRTAPLLAVPVVAKLTV